jgi:glycerate dehydrogenase
MRIVVLDGYTLNPGDLSWATLETLGDCTVYDRTPGHEVVRRTAGARVALTNKTVLSRDHLAQLPDLRYLGVLATGYNVVDLEAARERRICVTNVPAYSTASVVQLTFALLLELCHNVGHHARTVREGRWTRSLDFCYWDRPLHELESLSLGIVGFGRIGQAVARVADAFGLRVLAHTRTVPAPAPPAVQFVDLEPLFRQSDVVSLHCPLTDQTRQLINAQTLSWMKPSAFLLNTGRGGLVDEAALAAALHSNRLAGAGLDVLSQEPPPADHPLLRAPRCVVTPHFAWATRAARERLLHQAVENVRAFLDGQSRNVVS